MLIYERGKINSDFLMIIDEILVRDSYWSKSFDLFIESDQHV